MHIYSKTIAAMMIAGSAVPLAASSVVDPTIGAAVGGMIVVRDEVVRARTTDVWEFRFYGDEAAAVVVRGDGTTDLDLYVYDENGNLIASDTDASDYCIASWTPKWTGRFTIKIVNLGYVWNEYDMIAD